MWNLVDEISHSFVVVSLTTSLHSRGHSHIEISSVARDFPLAAVVIQ